MFLDMNTQAIIIRALYETIKEDEVTVFMPSNRPHIDVHEIDRFVEYLRTTTLPTETFIKLAKVLSEPHTYLTDEQAKLLGVNGGMKASRAVRRIAKRNGVELDNGRYARFADAINPIVVGRTFILKRGETDETYHYDSAIDVYSVGSGKATRTSQIKFKR